MDLLCFSLGGFKGEFRGAIITENVETWEYFNYGIHSVYLLKGKHRSTLELKPALGDFFFFFNFACYTVGLGHTASLSSLFVGSQYNRTFLHGTLILQMYLKETELHLETGLQFLKK